MDTLQVNICYRPLRIGWVIGADDISGFRQAVRLSYALWGGRFNPIVIADREEEARRLIDLFRVDTLIPIGEAQAARTFAARFPHFRRPFFHEGLFLESAGGEGKAQVLDIHNSLKTLRDTPGWISLRSKGVRVYSWDSSDPLSDFLLVHVGQYPNASHIGIDYEDLLIREVDATKSTIAREVGIPATILDHPTVASLSARGVEEHYSIVAGQKAPGFFVGELTNLLDLVYHWNLRAAGISLLFVDSSHFDRCADVMTIWDARTREAVSHRHEWDRTLGLWARRENIDQAREHLARFELMQCPISPESWNGHNVRVPMMYFGEVSTLAVCSVSDGRPKVSFSLPEKPFSSDSWFHTQHLVASLSFIGGLYGDEHYTFDPPFVPELNEFYSRTMHFRPDTVRIESERVGLVIDACDVDAFLLALQVSELIGKLFEVAGFATTPSPGGLIVRQLISQLGGLQGARLFKIPGVRRLLRTHGPREAFSKNVGIQLIAAKDPDNPGFKFSDYQDVYITARPIGSSLEPQAVFSYMVEKGLFRMGETLVCPACRLRSWIPLDGLSQRVVCELCGREYDATAQLVAGELQYRRSGVLGSEKNALGAVPVALTLQQLDDNLVNISHGSVYSGSLEIKTTAGGALCEIDFTWVIRRQYPERTSIILGECKDRGSIPPRQFEDIVANLRSVADAFPIERFDPFLLIAKLSPFTSSEIALAKSLNDRYRHRTILLTDKELEPNRIYERGSVKSVAARGGSTPEDLALATAEMYFRTKGVDQEA